jgi:hypothetical protein
MKIYVQVRRAVSFVSFYGYKQQDMWRDIQRDPLDQNRLGLSELPVYTSMTSDRGRRFYGIEGCHGSWQKQSH